jgi:creatinine amidohydrolase
MRGRHMDKLRRTRAYQPVLTDIRNIAPTGWYGNPSGATAERGVAMVEAIADAIAAEATELFTQLNRALGGAAEVKLLREVT